MDWYVCLSTRGRCEFVEMGEAMYKPQGDKGKGEKRSSKLRIVHFQRLIDWVFSAVRDKSKD